MDHDWSIKELHRLLLTSQAFRLSADRSSHNEAIDEANNLFWRWSPRRLDFESARDRLLHAAGTLETTIVGGRSIDLSNPSSNPRRSLYAFLDRYALPGIFLNFDVPHPDHHAPRRIQTTIPQQALFFLNNALPVQQAAKLSKHAEFNKLPNDEAKVRWIYQRLFRRAPDDAELRDAVAWIQSADPSDYEPKLIGHWQIGYRPANSSPDTPLTPFPVFHQGAWKTAADFKSSPIPYLYAGPVSGHASDTHDLILRWVAHGSGEVRMSGSLKRTQQGGVTLHWAVADTTGTPLQQADLAPEAKAELSSPWLDINAGDHLDFILRGPNGSTCGGVAWDLRISGRESSTDKPQDLSSIKRHFPKTNTPPALPTPDSPWGDLIQALWASNEFNYIH
jgi:hypothetical protein